MCLQFAVLESDSVDDDLASLKQDMLGTSKVRLAPHTLNWVPSVSCKSFLQRAVYEYVLLSPSPERHLGFLISDTSIVCRF